MTKLALVVCSFGLLATAVLAAPHTAFAATCTFSSSSINFGSFNVYSGALSGTGSVNGNCTGPKTANPGRVTFGNGLHYQSSSGNRAMGCSTCTGIFASDLLQYQLYTDAGHTTIWIGATSVQVFAKGDTPPFSWSATIYGVIFAAVAGGINDSAVGTYSDTVTATLNY